MTTTLFATTYARVTGAVLLLTGLVGIVSLATGYIGFLALDFLAWDTTHNVLHVLLGAIALYVGFAPKAVVDPLTYGKAFGIVYTLLAVLGFIAPASLGFLGLGLETGENLIHLLVGVLGLVAGFYVVEAEGTPGTPATTSA